MTQTADVMQGTLGLLILKALALEPVHGWGISERIQQMSRGAFRIGQGSLYPALHRLENRGWLTSYWRTTSNKRIARIYELTPAGRTAVDKEIADWRFYTSAIDLVIDAR